MKRAFSFRRNRAALRGLVRRLARNRRGVAAVEFAFLLPVMLTVYFGIVEVAQGVMVDRKLTELNRAVGDLTAQSTVISNTEMSNIFDAATTIMAPFTGVAPRMAVSSIVIDALGVAKICWSAQRNSTAPARGSTVTLPTSMNIPSTSLIMAVSSYDFTPTIGYLITGSIKVGDSPIYLRPRIGKAGGTNSIEQVERSGVAMCPLFN